MRYVGPKGGWHALATACLNNAVKQSDYDCVRYDVFSTICGLAYLDEGDVKSVLKYAEQMKNQYGDKWYKGIENEKTTRISIGLLKEAQERNDRT